MHQPLVRTRVQSSRLGALVGAALLLLSLGFTYPTSAAERQRLIVRVEKPYEAFAAAVERLGGEVSYRFRNVDAVAIVIPADRQGELAAIAGAAAIHSDEGVEPPRALDRVPLGVLPVAAARGPSAYAGAGAGTLSSRNLNHHLTGAAQAHRRGLVGEGIVVAVLDTGTANSPLASALAGAVVGGEDFSSDAGSPSATSSANDHHGTWVGSLIAGHADLTFPDGSPLVQSALEHAPQSVIADCPAPGSSCIALVGTAPAASLYAMKVFPAAGGPSPSSVILAAMDRAITLRRSFDAFGPCPEPIAGDGSEEHPFVFACLDIDVVAMPLGGPTLFAAGDLKDQLTERMLEAGITPVIAAGNTGPAAITGESPGSGRGALTVGAASITANHRILLDLLFGPGAGLERRPAGHHQTALFSARGPSPDGRFSIDVVAGGHGQLVQGATGEALMLSGTSLSTPTVAGAAALLHGAAPSADAFEIRNALRCAANPALLGHGSGAIDQGRGLIDIPGALALLEAGHPCLETPLQAGLGHRSVKKNLERLGLRTIRFSGPPGARIARRALRHLVAGEVRHFFVESSPQTDRLTFSLADVGPEGGIYLVVADAPTSVDHLRVLALVDDQATFEVDHPQSGLIRVAAVADSRNAGAVSADLVIRETRRPQPPPAAVGGLPQDVLHAETVTVPAGLPQVVFELSWAHHWGLYPTDDLDLAVMDPAGNLNLDGVTAASPERIVVDDPMPGEWTVFLFGETVHGVHGGPEARWQLRVVP